MTLTGSDIGCQQNLNLMFTRYILLLDCHDHYITHSSARHASVREATLQEREYERAVRNLRVYPIQASHDGRRLCLFPIAARCGFALMSRLGVDGDKRSLDRYPGTAKVHCMPASVRPQMSLRDLHKQRLPASGQGSHHRLNCPFTQRPT